MKIGIVSGYFNPIHGGHIDYINEAKANNDLLVVIVNSDQQVQLKKSVPFMDELHRCQIVSNLKSVDFVTISIDTDSTVCKTIESIKSKFPNDDLTFYNSGDRVGTNIDSSEQKFCRLIGVSTVALLRSKRYSSSDLIKNVAMLTKEISS